MSFQVKGHETYKTLPAQTAQQILKKVEDNWHSFFNAIRQWKVTPSKFRSRPRPPRYKGKNGRFPAYFTRQQCKIRDGYIRFPKTKLFLQTRVYEPLHEIRVVPEGNCYKVEVVYEHHIPELTSREPERVASIDLGLNNLVTLLNNISEQPIVINDKVAKSVNRYYNKERSKLMRNVGERGTSNR